MRSNNKNCFSRVRMVAMAIGLFVIIPMHLTAQSKPRQPGEADWPCTNGKDFLRDRYGKAVWLNSQELEGRVRKETPLQTPGTLGRNNLHGAVTLQVLIGKDGTVQCARVSEGHPVAIAPAITAIQDWVFEPYTYGHEPYAVLGEILVKYDFSR